VEKLPDTAETRAMGLEKIHVRLRPNPKRYFSIFERKRSIRLIQRWIRNRLATRHERLILYLERRKQFTVISIQAAYRGRRSRAKHVSIKKQRNAAMCIQSKYRAYVVKKKIYHKNLSAKCIQRRVRARIREKEKVIQGQRRHDAAIKIQCVCRGRNARKHVTSIRKRKHKSRQHRAAIQIQRVSRGRAVRRAIREEEKTAATSNEIVEAKLQSDDDEEDAHKQIANTTEKKLEESSSSSDEESPSESEESPSESDDDEDISAHDVFRTEF